MTTDRQLDERISAWLEAEAPRQLPDRVLRTTFERTRRTKQHRGLLARLRRPTMNKLVPIGAGAAAVVIAVVIGSRLFAPAPSSGVGAPAVTPTAAPTATPTPAPTATTQPSGTALAGLPVGSFDLEDTGLAMTVTIPSPGWTFQQQFTVLQKGTEVANLPEAAILFWAFPPGSEFSVPGDPCQVDSTQPDAPATTLDEIAAALAAQASREASEPVDVTLGGYPGKSLTQHVPDDVDFADCERGQFVTYGDTRDPLQRTQQGPGQIDELWILEVEDRFVILDAMYREDTPQALIDELRSIATSTTFGD